MIKEKLEKNRKEILLILILMILAVLMGLFFPRTFVKSDVAKKTSLEQYAMGLNNQKNINFISDNLAVSENDFVYLSDIDYIPSQSKSGWGSLLKDKTSAGGKIAVRVEGAFYTFDKGMWAHASSTLVYDISEYDYEFFTAFIGLNQTAASSSNGVKYIISTSKDGKTWDIQKTTGVLTTATNAEFIKINIKGANYLKLVADSNGSNGNDHSVYADAKLTNVVDDGNITKSVEEYDELIKTKYPNADLNNPEYELLLLQRNLVKNMGQYAIKRFVSESTENKATFNWLFNDLENLRLYTMGGKPDGGSYYNSLTQLKRILEKHISDFDITEETNYGRTYGDLYKQMAITLSLTHSTNVYLWMQASHPSNVSDAVTRYEIYKMLHKNGKLVVSNRQDHTKWFEDLETEEMRYVLNNIIDDEEILWLNEYTQKRIDAHPNQEEKYLQPHTYIAYVWPNYGNPIFHDPARKDYWDEKFEGIFSKYGVTYSSENDKVYKVWMNLRNEFGTGAVCGGISKLGSNIRGVHGTPSSVISQPGHAAIIYYRQNGNGDGYWTIDNDISGWAQSGKTERLSIRMPLGWGNDSYVNGWAASYIVLAQEAMNDFENYEKSEKKIMIADVYNNDNNKKEEILREALNIQNINIDAWWELIKLYKSDSTKTESDFYALAEEVGEALLPFPLPMKNLLDQIKGKFVSPEYVFKYSLLEAKLLNTGKTYNQTDKVLQPGITRTVASFLLGQTNTQLATFSFDGENAGKIMLSDRFDGNGVRWDYSLDGKQTWNEVSSTADEEHSVTLTKEEIEKITAENDIYVHIVGANYSEENVYRIDILDKTIVNTNYYGNDWENRVIGIDLTYEWRRNENEPWTSYKTASPDNTGNKTLQIRQSAVGTYLASNVLEFQFTEDNQPDTEKYIPISHLSIEEYSTQSVDSGRPFYAPNAIDGNINTRWHTDFRYNVLQQDTKPFITIKLDQAKFISAVEFVQTKYKTNDPDDIKNMIVYVSEDGKTWTEAGRIENCERNSEFKKIKFNESVHGQYVKLEMDTYDMFASLAMVNLFEDITKQDVVLPTASIGYDKTTITNGNVLARLVNPSTKITITNPSDGSDTHIFTENGEFKFEFVDEDGNKGFAVANVNWIDKKDPSGSISYSSNKPTTKTIDATLVNLNESVYLLDENNQKVNYVEVKDEKVVYIEYLDLKGNKTKILHLDDNGNTEQIEYYYRQEGKDLIIYNVYLDSNGTVIKRTFTNDHGEELEQVENEEEIRKLDEMGRSKPLVYTFENNGTYSFKLQDLAGNTNTITAKVDWIDREIPTANITYSKTEATSDEVVATITLSEAGTITNNGGSHTYTFKENGEFTFTFQDLAGNTNSATAIVNWIEKKVEIEKPNIRLHYSEEKRTTKPVTVVLINQGSPITITNNDGENSYTFKENGEFTFEYVDLLGNKGSITAKVDWIEKSAENNNNHDGNTNDTTDKDNSNNNSSSNNNNTANNSANKGSSTTTSTNKPNANSSMGSNDTNSTTKPSTNDYIDNENNQTINNSETQNNSNKNESKTEENKPVKEETKKEEKNNKLKFAFIGFLSLIVVITFIRYKIKRKL